MDPDKNNNKNTNKNDMFAEFSKPIETKDNTASVKINSDARRVKYYNSKIKELTVLQNQAAEGLKQYDAILQWDESDRTINYLYDKQLTKKEDLEFMTWLSMMSDLTTAKGRIMGFKPFFN